MSKAVIIVSLLSVSAHGYTWADTLTIIQKPILNVPALVEPGGEFEAWLKSPSATADWQGELLLNGINYPLSKTFQMYLNAYGVWAVTFRTMENLPLELYDFRVYNTEYSDISQHAVSVDWETPGNYQFAIICDSHLPTVGYWTSPEPDSSVIPDMLAVYDDLAIINPRFILHLGDLTDQGYMEEYQGRHQMGRAQEVLAQSPAPIFLIAGNHDVGGCNSPNSPFTPGCSRYYWWQYFGWSWLDNPPDNHYTQDYTFAYGGDLFIGMESYELYDRWRQEIYNYLSFCPTALDWLNNILSNSSEYNNRILFTHWDYTRQIDPTAMNLDMVLYGHLHINYGELNQQPYVLSVENVIEHFKSPYGRAFMLVSVEDGVLHPHPTLYAGHAGQNLTIDYYPDNSGAHAFVTAVIENSMNYPFPNAMVKINYPIGIEDFEVQNGELLQTIDYSSTRVLYIRTDVPANGDKVISVISNSMVGGRTRSGGNLSLLSCYPMPFNSSTIFYFELKSSSQVELHLYSINGQLVSKIAAGSFPAGKSQVRFKNTTLPSGIYFARLRAGNDTLMQKVIILR